MKAKTYTEQDYVCDLAAIPVDDARFDHVRLTQVLEHLPEPATVLAELRRVLKPGGTLWLTAPLFYAEHERPYDFFRYTPFGLAPSPGRRRVHGRGDRLAPGLSRHPELPGPHDEQGASPRHRADYGGGLTGLALATDRRRPPRPLPAALADALAKLDLEHKFVGKRPAQELSVVARKPG